MTRRFTIYTRYH